ncbi:HlyD family efflux transporter periplasmic adaptor subunit [bacterium]|nr:HlyD family efflux transporter periplasmic adaptor subunit [bacterium]
MKKIVVIGVAVVIVIFIVLGATRVTGSRKNKKNEDKIEVVRRGEFIVKIKETGYLEPLLSVEIKSNVEGEIKKLNVKDGDKVEKGQILLKIDDARIVEEKKQTQANLDAATAQLEQAKLNTNLTEQQQDSGLKQSDDAVEVATAAYEAAKATADQRVSQAETDIATTKNYLEQDRIALEQANISLQQARLALAQYQAAEKSAKVNLDNAESDLKRIEELYEKEFVSKKALEDAQAQRANTVSQYESAQKSVESQKQTVESQEANIRTRQKALDTRQTTLDFQERNLETIKQAQVAQLRQSEVQLQTAQTRLKQFQESINDEKQVSQYSESTAKANLLRAESNLKNAEERLQWTKVIAPMAGTVTDLRVEEGEIVISGRSAFSSGPAIMQIADLSKMVLKTNIVEVEIAKVKLGQKVEIEVDAFSDKKYEGEVTEISPSGQQRQGENVITFELTIEVLGSPEELRPGMKAKANIIVINKDDVLQLPIETVLAPETIVAKATVNRSDLSKLEVGKEIKIENLAGKQFKGKVGKISPDEERENVEILIEEKEARGLRAGPTEIAIVLSEEDKPKVQALIESERKYFVMLDKKEDKSKSEGKKDKKSKTKGVKTQIRVGEHNETHYEILSGVKVGDRVFVQSVGELAKRK